MELPPREEGDRLLKPGELLDIRRRLRTTAAGQDLASVIVCAFDHRTRMLPFIYADTNMAPAGARAIGSALVDSGFDKTRIVLQHWNRNVSPPQMRLDGRVPDMLLISSMGMHIGRATALIRDACAMDPAERPLIIAGGSSCLYSPWDLFSTDANDPWGPDIAVTGEEYVFLALLEAILDARAPGEPMRSAFARARDGGALDGIPGLVYCPDGPEAPVRELVDTGIQRLCGDLDELPDPVLGYRLLEPPSRGKTLGPAALEAGVIRRHTPVSSLVMTFGCRFSCGYCPIPAYNQRTYRMKSGQRIAEELGRLHSQYGIRYFFGADDNFFNDPPRALEIMETIAATPTSRRPLRRKIRLGTEVTVHDVLQMKEHLPMIRRCGMRALWMGVEDMTGTLVKKGQTVDKTIEAFHALRDNGLAPMPMMMHHDDQPLWTRGNHNGLLNQVRLLKKAGAVSMQVLMITPSAGSRLYRETFETGMVIKSAGKREADMHMWDGNFVIASRHARPWRKQYNLILAYLSFYNIFRLIKLFIWRRDRTDRKPFAVQIFGIAGLFHTFVRTFSWGLRLAFCKITRLTEPPRSPFPMRGPGGEQAPHDVQPERKASA